MTALRELATAAGLDVEYRGWNGVAVVPSDESLVAVLRALAPDLGVAFETAADAPAALAALERANNQAKKSLDDLAQMQQMREGSSGMPMGIGARSSLSGPGSSSDAGRRRRSGGRRGTDVRNFVIPGRQDHQVPKLYREEIMKSLRDGYPLPYEERIKDYYQRIAE
jgi:hypothetical protein